MSILNKTIKNMTGTEDTENITSIMKAKNEVKLPR